MTKYNQKSAAYLKIKCFTPVMEFDTGAVNLVGKDYPRPTQRPDDHCFGWTGGGVVVI